MFFKCCNFKKKEKIKVSCSYCNTSPYSKCIYVDYYNKDMTIRQLKDIILLRINNEPTTIMKYKKIYFINIKQIKNNETLRSLNTNEINLIYDLE